MCDKYVSSYLICIEYLTYRPVVVCSHPNMWTEMNNLLQIGNIHGQLFCYDTTFHHVLITHTAMLMHNS